MIHRNDLFNDLSEEVIKKTLEACSLKEKDEYLDEEGERFLQCRDLVNGGKSYKEAIAMMDNTALENGSSDVEQAKVELKVLLEQLAPETVQEVVDEIAQERAQFQEFVRQGARNALAQELIAQANSGKLEEQLTQKIKEVKEGKALHSNVWIEIEGTPVHQTKQLPGL